MEVMIQRKDWENGTARCLSKGRAGNARVYLVTKPEGAFVVKDFRKSPWWIRLTWGCWMVHHEMYLMSRLDGIYGIPQKLQKIDAFAFAMEYLEGETIGDFIKRRRDDPSIPPLSEAYFETLEKMVFEIHRRKVTHLDNRNAKNVMILKDGHPALLDFQAGVALRWWMPGFIKNILKLADISGVYKHWYKIREALSEDRKETLRRHFRLRRLWVFKGYTLFKRRKPKGLERYLFEDQDKGAR